MSICAMVNQNVPKGKKAFEPRDFMPYMEQIEHKPVDKLTAMRAMFAPFLKDESDT